MVRILALEPYCGGSHKAFLDEWTRGSRHRWTILGLPDTKWRWRMRHAPLTLAEQTREHAKAGERWDVLFCSDMLDLPTFRGLVGAPVAQLPAVVYFHENQLTYPRRDEAQRDLHYAYSNALTALAAERVWFNSAFHRDTFLRALDDWLNRMPDYAHADMVTAIRSKSEIHYPPVPAFAPKPPRSPGPMRILWAARWEQDKRPDRFFEALRGLETRGVPFALHCVGGTGGRYPAPVFEEARRHFRDHILRWGYCPDRAEYVRTLLDSDVAVSTADHEFFGIGMVEATAAGVYPLVPRKLAYPEIFDCETTADTDSFFYDGPPAVLATRLVDLAIRLDAGALWQGDLERGRRAVARFSSAVAVARMDDALTALAS